jgi:hypothetical protein
MTVLWLALSLLSAASMAFYVAYIWSANQPPGFSDLYAPWWAAHELLLHGRNPYSPQVAHEIQTVIYGAPVTPSADDPSGMAGGFAYPPYAALLLAPTVYLPFAVAQKICLLAATLLTGVSLALWRRISHWQIPPLDWIMAGLFLFGSFPAMQALRLQNLSLVAAGLIAITIYFVSKERLVLGGIFLASSTFKPQFTVVLTAWLVLWTLAQWRRRQALAWSFLSAILLLGLISEWLAPGWVHAFLDVVRAYRHYTYGHSLLDVWFRGSVGAMAGAALLFAALFLCWRERSQSAGSTRFFLATSLALGANLVVIPSLAPHAQLLLLPGFLGLLSGGLWAKWVRLLGVAAWMLLAWPWVASFGLLLAAVWLPLETVRRFWEVPLYTSPLLPLGITLAVGALLESNRSRRAEQVHPRD